MTSGSESTPTPRETGGRGEPAEDTTSSPSSPYDIGLAADEDETGPKPLDTDLEDEQVKRDS